MLKIASHDLVKIVERLSRFARDAGIGGDKETYVQFRNELLPRRAVEADSVLLMRVFNAHRRLMPMDLPFSARRIHIRHNARILGLRRIPGTTARVQLAAKQIAESTFRECRVRRIVSAHLDQAGGLRIPDLRAWDRRGHWLIEDEIEGSLADAAAMARFVERHMAALYRPSARPRRIRRLTVMKPFIDGLQGVLAKLAPAFPPISNDARWLVGLCHNDLHAANFVIDRGDRFWLIDWEKAGVVPLAADFGNVYLEHPELKAPLLKLLAAFDPSGETLPVVHQLALGAAYHLQFRVIHRRPRIDAAVHTEGKGRQDAEAEYERAMARDRQTVAGLADDLT
jgi:hypothetical protein